MKAWISLSELRLSLRYLRKQPVVTLTTVLTLAVGIGMATTGFTMLDAVLYSKLPYPNGDRFVLLDAYTEPESQRAGIGQDRFRFLAERATSLEHLGAFRGVQVNLTLPGGEVVSVAGAMLTPDSVRVFPHAPVAGRLLQKEDGDRGAPPVALLRESLWRRHFSGDPRAIGSMATMAGVRRQIVGVMPDGFEFPSAAEIWLPLGESDSVAANPWASARAFGVLRPGREPGAADAQVAALSKQFEADTPAAPRLRTVVLRFTEAISRGLGLLSFALVSCLVLVLVVMAANIANLVLARTASRSRELAVRTALGATRARLVSQVFVEVLLIGTVAATIALIASQAVLGWLSRTATDMPFWVDFSASPRTMAFVVFATLLAVCVGGVLPALKATRRDTAGAMAISSRSASTGFGATGGVMVALQVALSIALLNGAMLMARGVAGYMSPSSNVPPSEVLTARIWSETSDPAAIVDAVAAMPGISAAAGATSLPGLSPDLQMTALQPSPSDPPAVARPAPVVAVRGAFFEAFGAQPSAGRLFGAVDFAENAPPVAVVNEPFVAKFFAGRNPIGQRIRTLPATPGAEPGPWREVIGVVPDLGLSAGDEAMAGGFYVPMTTEDLFHVVVRAAGDARGLAGPLRAAVDRVDPSVQVREVTPLADVGREDRAVFAGIGAALAVLGGMALLLSVIGTYAILSLSVTRRTREIGIRAALGASRRQVLQAIMTRTCLPPALGALLGVALGQALVAARGIFAFRLPESSGPWGLPVLAAVMIAAGLLSAWVPARRALAVAPAEALRAE